jgi:hypothetical protein
MKFKCAMLALAFVCVAGTANAADWMKFGDSDSGAWYVDAASVKVTGNEVSFWTKLELSAKGRTQSPPGEMSSLMRARAVCGDGNITIDSNVGYGANGNVVATADQPHTMPTPPDSIYGNMVNMVCEAKHIPQ